MLYYKSSVNENYIVKNIIYIETKEENLSG